MGLGLGLRVGGWGKKVWGNESLLIVRTLVLLELEAKEGTETDGGSRDRDGWVVKEACWRGISEELRMSFESVDLERGGGKGKEFV